MNEPVTRKGFIASIGALLVLTPWRNTAAAQIKSVTEPARVDPLHTAVPPPPEPKHYVFSSFYVAGLSYYPGATLVAAGGVKSGDALKLTAEPGNPHDRFAIEVRHCASGVKLGYVLRADNRHLSRLLLQGAPVQAVAVAVAPDAETWEAVDVEVRLAIAAVAGGTLRRKRTG